MFIFSSDLVIYFLQLEQKSFTWDQMKDVTRRNLEDRNMYISMKKSCYFQFKKKGKKMENNSLKYAYNCHNRYLQMNTIR